MLSYLFLSDRLADDSELFHAHIHPYSGIRSGFGQATAIPLQSERSSFPFVALTTQEMRAMWPGPLYSLVYLHSQYYLIKLSAGVAVQSSHLLQIKKL